MPTSNFEENLKTEMWTCHKFMELSMSDFNKMTVYDRKYYIIIHNRLVDMEKERLEKISKKK